MRTTGLKRGMLIGVLTTLSMTVLLSPGVSMAQQNDDSYFRITPYLWMLGIDGTTAVLGQDTDFDMDFGDILDVLNIALSVNMEWNTGQWFFVLDPVLNENFDIYAGARYYDQDITIGFDGTILPTVNLGDDWTDFLIGFRAHNQIGEKWSFGGRLDGAVAGDSDSAWYLQAVLMRHFGENKHLDLGWRYYDVDYESGSGLTRFKWDATHSGPVVGFSWTF